jgi:murein L,D-transpeptidase YcbB/YkuD
MRSTRRLATILPIALATVAASLPAPVGATESRPELSAEVLPALAMPTAPPDIANALQAPAQAPPTPAPAAPAPAVTTEQPSPAAVAPGPPPVPAKTRLIIAEVRARLAAGEPRGSTGQRAHRVALAKHYEDHPERALWTDEAGLTPRGKAAIKELKAADDWGLRAADFVVSVPAAPPGGELTVEALADLEVRIGLAVLEYAHQARGGRTTPTQISPYLDRAPPVLAPARVLADLAGTSASDTYLRRLHPRHPQFELLRQKWLELKRADASRPALPPAPSRAAPPGLPSRPGPGPRPQRPPTEAMAPPEPASARRLLINMEMWRWMPEGLGASHVIANVPEFMVRYVKGSAVLHEERMIVGKTDTQTPIFTDEMEHLVFHPVWGVPESIKVKEILPSLARGSNILARHNLRLQVGGRDIDPWSVDWSSVDIRRVHVYQPPGGDNVLGVVKFMFPNKHQVYMHDTPTKQLFAAPSRTFSHGCMRIRDPLRFAEVLLGEDKGWTRDRIQQLVASGPENNLIPLQRKIPVHVTYFTAVVGADGRLTMLRDIYGHEENIGLALDGKAHLIVRRKDDAGPGRADVVTRLADTRDRGGADWRRRAFRDY